MISVFVQNVFCSIVSVAFIFSVETLVFPDYTIMKILNSFKKELKCSYFMKRKIQSGNTEFSIEEGRGKDCLMLLLSGDLLVSRNSYFSMLVTIFFNPIKIGHTKLNFF